MIEALNDDLNQTVLLCNYRTADQPEPPSFLLMTQADSVTFVKWLAELLLQTEDHSRLRDLTGTETSLLDFLCRTASNADLRDNYQESLAAGAEDGMLTIDDYVLFSLVGRHPDDLPQALDEASINYEPGSDFQLCSS